MFCWVYHWIFWFRKLQLRTKTRYCKYPQLNWNVFYDTFLIIYSNRETLARKCHSRKVDLWVFKEVGNLNWVRIARKRTSRVVHCIHSEKMNSQRNSFEIRISPQWRERAKNTCFYDPWNTDSTITPSLKYPHGL